jgi:hypothetical protein
MVASSASNSGKYKIHVEPLSYQGACHVTPQQKAVSSAVNKNSAGVAK